MRKGRVQLHTEVVALRKVFVGSDEVETSCPHLFNSHTSFSGTLTDYLRRVVALQEQEARGDIVLVISSNRRRLTLDI